MQSVVIDCAVSRDHPFGSNFCQGFWCSASIAFQQRNSRNPNHRVVQCLTVTIRSIFQPLILNPSYYPVISQLYKCSGVYKYIYTTYIYIHAHIANIYSMIYIYIRNYIVRYLHLNIRIFKQCNRYFILPPGRFSLARPTILNIRKLTI